MDDKKYTNSIGFFGLLQLAFIILKLCNVIKWSWLWVLAPTWITIGLILLTGIVALIILIIGGKEIE